MSDHTKAPPVAVVGHQEPRGGASISPRGPAPPSLVADRAARVAAAARRAGGRVLAAVPRELHTAGLELRAGVWRVRRRSPLLGLLGLLAAGEGTAVAISAQGAALAWLGWDERRVDGLLDGWDEAPSEIKLASSNYARGYATGAMLRRRIRP